ncbi:MAG: enoyl-CoA hydratase family protein [Chloroflexota bacterium]
MYDFDFAVSEGVATITLNRPEVLNALTFDIYAQLRDLMATLQYDDAVKVVVITGAGSAFCSGGDVYEIIEEMLARDTRAHLEFCRMTGALVQNMRLLEKPIIAALNGTTAGAGAVIALASDFRLMSEKARIHFLFTKVGLTGADMGAAYLLPRIVGQGRAAEILMFGDKIYPSDALQMGLVNRVLPPEELMTTANAWATRLATGPTLAYGMTKRMLNNEWNMDLVSAIEQEAQAQTILMMAQDHRIFFESFRDKIEPEWSGR